MAMNRAQLVASIQARLGRQTSKAAAERALDAVVDSIKEGVIKQRAVQIIGFGTFKAVHRRARNGVNPRTAGKIRIGPTKNVKFVTGTAFRERL